MQTLAKGDLAEAMVLARFVELGWTVLKPWGTKRYDLVVDRGKGFERVQVKSGRVRNGTIIFNAYSIHRNNKRMTYIGDADLFAVYCHDTKKTYLLEVSQNTNTITLRLEATKNNQGRHVTWAKDFEL
jgi:hypothetical protein